MCGRFFLRPDVDEILRVFDALAEDLPPQEHPRHNVAPTQDVLAVWRDPLGPRRLGAFRWGLVPAWWKGGKLPAFLNARGEEARQKPAFRGAWRTRRLLVPASGFYEWRAEGRRKVPYAIDRPDGGLLAMAGLWETWLGGPEPLRSLTVLTCGPCDDVAPLHDRMPVLLPPEAWATWLDPRTPDHVLTSLVHPWTGPVRVRRVGDGVNKATNTDGRWFDEADDLPVA